MRCVYYGLAPVTWRCEHRPGRRLTTRLCARHTDRSLGGIRSDLRQTAAATAHDPGRGQGAARPPAVGAGGAHQITDDERGRRSIGRFAISGGRREQQPAAGPPHRQRSGAAYRYPRLTAGTIRRPDLSKRIWWLIAGRSRGAVSCKP